MRHLTAACIGFALLLGLAGKAHSTSSLAWLKIIDAQGAGLSECTDPFGNVACGYTEGGRLTVKKFDPYGGELWSSSNLMLLTFSLFSVTADELGNVYALGVQGVSTQSYVILKFGPDGSSLWATSSGFVNGSFTPLAMQADNAGVRIALDAAITGNTPALFVYYFDTNGVQTAGYADNTIMPSRAKFCLDGNLLVSGNDPSNPGTGHCRLINSSGTDIVNYSVGGYCLGESDIFDNVYILGDTDASTPFFNISKFDSLGNQQWITNATNGRIDYFSVAFPNQVFCFSAASGKLELFDPDIVAFPQSGPPTPVFRESAGFATMTADPGGGIVTKNGNTLWRYDLHGVATWAQSLMIANMTSPIQSVSIPSTSGSQLGPDPVYIAGIAQKSGTSNYAMFVGKYVGNTAALGLTLSPTYVTGGSPVVGTVKLNSNAGPGGASVAIASSFPAFVNTPVTMTIPQGSSTGTFAATTVPVDVPGAVTLSATFGGARRSAVVNVIPATLFSVTTPVSMVKGGTYVTGTVNLTGRAGPAGRSAAVSSSNSAAASVPPGVNVAPYASSVNFVIATHAVSSNTSVTITARSGTVTKTTTLTVTP